MSSAELGMSIRCQEIVELVTDYLEGALDATTHRRFEAHLGICPPCVAFVDQLRTTLDAAGRVALADLSETAKLDLLAAFRDFTAR